MHSYATQCSTLRRWPPCTVFIVSSLAKLPYCSASLCADVFGNRRYKRFVFFSFFFSFQESGKYGMLPTDIALITDPAFKPFVEKYAADEQAFFDDFAKVSLRGVRTRTHTCSPSRSLIPCKASADCMNLLVDGCICES